MSDLQQIFGAGFDTNSVKPAEDYEVIPAGKYPLLVDKAEVKDTKTGTGKYIELTLSVLDGKFKGRKLWERINIINPNSQCEEIGRRTLSALGIAIGLQVVQDTSELTNKVCIGSVKVDKDGNNSIRTFYSVSDPKAQDGVKETMTRQSQSDSPYNQSWTPPPPPTQPQPTQVVQPPQTQPGWQSPQQQPQWTPPPPTFAAPGNPPTVQGASNVPPWQRK